MGSMSAISNQIQIIVSQVCGRCGHLIEEITNLYEEEFRKLRDDLQRANEMIAKMHGKDIASEPPDEGDTQPEESAHYQIEQIEFTTVNIKNEIEVDEMDIIGFKVESPNSNTEHSDTVLVVERSEENDTQTSDVDKTFQCKEANCSRRYLARSALLYHIKRIHLNKRPYVCGAAGCDKAFSSPSELKRHVQTQKHGHLPQAVTFECIMCKQAFENKRMLVEHLHNSHTEYDETFASNRTQPSNDRFPCKVPNCGGTYSSLRNLNQHMIYHSSETPFSCKLLDCNEAFRSRLRLARHKASIHNIKLKEPKREQFKCPQCEVIVNKSLSLKYHIKRVHLNEKTYRCKEPNCDKSFFYPSELARHLEIHQTSRSFLCSECGKGYAAQHLLKSHMNVHIGFRPFPCEHPGCGKSFFTSSSLYSHKFRHSADRRFPCTWPDCKSASTSLGDLKNHMRIHTGERPFCCHFEGCGLAFNTSSTLRKHINVVHLNIRPYKCGFSSCDRVFGTSSSHKAHLKTHKKKSCSDTQFQLL